MIGRKVIAGVCSLGAMFVLTEWSATAIADTITLTNAALYVQAYNGVFNVAPVDHQQNPSALPYINLDTIAQGPSSASATYALTFNGFDIQSVLTRAGGQVPDAYGIVNGTIKFAANEDLNYALSGVLDATNPEILQEVFIRDETLSSYAFFQLQVINNFADTGPRHFDLGIQTGDPGLSSLQGSLTGTLIAGHNYTFYYENTIKAAPNVDTGATGSGRTTLLLSSTAAAPLPSVALGGLCLCGVLLVPLRWRKRSCSGQSRLDCLRPCLRL